MLDYRTVYTQVESWLAKAGSIVLEGLKEDPEVTKFTEFGPVTDAACEAEEYLVRAIRRRYPEHSVHARLQGTLENGSGYRWVVDPLDGMVNYVRRFPAFGISLAFEEQGETVLGAVYLPMFKELFHAFRGRGAFLNGDRITVSPVDNLSRAVLSTGLPYNDVVDPGNLDYFNHLKLRIGGISRSGSTACDLCNVARGTVDGYWGFKAPLGSIAAGALIVSEAGGKVDYLECRNGLALIAGNGRINEAICREMAGVDRGLK